MSLRAAISVTVQMLNALLLGSDIKSVMDRKIGYLCFKNVTYAINSMVSEVEGYHSFVLCSFVVSVNGFKVII
jgi:hypothetical protein